MSETTRHINTVLLVTSGLSAENSVIVANEIHRIESEVRQLRKVLRYVAYQRLPLGNSVIETLPEHWQAEVEAALEENA